MNSGDIKKMQAQQVAKMQDVRNLALENANSDLKSAEILVQLNNGFWLSEIALQLAVGNELRGPKAVYYVDEPSMWEKVFGHKANE